MLPAATGCRIVTHTFRDALPHEILDKYPTVDFDPKCLMTDPIMNQ